MDSPSLADCRYGGPTLAERRPKLVHEFTYQAVCGSPRQVGVGPDGARQYYELPQGVVEGQRLTGKLLGSGSDWTLTGSDGFMRMDVRVQIETHDGAIICTHYFGPAEANEKLQKAIANCVPTEFSDQSIRSHWLLETGDPRYGWVNQAVFVGEGRLLPGGPGVLGFEHRVYRVG